MSWPANAGGTTPTWPGNRPEEEGRGGVRMPPGTYAAAPPPPWTTGVSGDGGGFAGVPPNGAEASGPQGMPQGRGAGDSRAAYPNPFGAAGTAYDTRSPTPAYPPPGDTTSMESWAKAGAAYGQQYLSNVFAGNASERLPSFVSALARNAFGASSSSDAPSSSSTPWVAGADPAYATRGNGTAASGGDPATFFRVPKYYFQVDVQYRFRGRRRRAAIPAAVRGRQRARPLHSGDGIRHLCAYRRVCARHTGRIHPGDHGAPRHRRAGGGRRRSVTPADGTVRHQRARHPLDGHCGAIRLQVCRSGDRHADGDVGGPRAPSRGAGVPAGATVRVVDDGLVPAAHLQADADAGGATTRGGMERRPQPRHRPTSGQAQLPAAAHRAHPDSALPGAQRETGRPEVNGHARRLRTGTYSSARVSSALPTAVAACLVRTPVVGDDARPPSLAPRGALGAPCGATLFACPRSALSSDIMAVRTDVPAFLPTAAGFRLRKQSGARRAAVCSPRPTGFPVSGRAVRGRLGRAQPLVSGYGRPSSSKKLPKKEKLEAEEVFYDGPPSWTELIIPAVSVLTPADPGAERISRAPRGRGGISGYQGGTVRASVWRLGGRLCVVPARRRQVGAACSAQL
eukprot:ctg_341.g114